jgi:CubicO group peptidase (beta-lactamase class C family)
MRKVISLSLLLLVFLGLAVGFNYAWTSFPLISAYGSKIMCSCVFLAGRSAESVHKQELNAFPINLGNFEVDSENMRVVGTVFGTAKRAAIYRDGMGCTLLAGTDEEEIRSQAYYAPQKPNFNQDLIPWPNGNIISDSLKNLPHYRQIQKLINFELEDSIRKIYLSHVFLVVHKGELVAEGYGNDHIATTKHTAWSMGKSILSTLIGLQVDQGKIDLNQTNIYPSWTDERSKITLTHMLQASNGLDWEEDYAGVSDATNMLFLKPNGAEVAAAKPLKYKPGSYFYYSSGTTNILSQFLRTQLGEEAYQKLPYEGLFNKIGMHNTVMEKDASGTFLGSSFVFATGRDFARFGLLMLNKGNWQGEQILSEEWVKFATTPTAAASRGEYGAQWWLNAGSPSNPQDKLFPDLPNDAFYAGGFEGQWILVIPSQELVIVRLGYTPKGEFSMNDFAASVIDILNAS